jgi:hypothetical protein
VLESFSIVGVTNRFRIPAAVVVLFRATGDAPIMKQSKFKVCEQSLQPEEPYAFVHAGRLKCVFFFFFLCVGFRVFWECSSSEALRDCWVSGVVVLCWVSSYVRWVLLSWPQITGTEKFAKVIEFLRKQLHRETLVSFTCSALRFRFVGRGWGLLSM